MKEKKKGGEGKNEDTNRLTEKKVHFSKFSKESKRKTTPPISQPANSASTIVNNTSLIAIPREKERNK